MPAIKRISGGRIAGLFAGNSRRQAKTPVCELMLTFDGIEGDAHAGRSRASGAREAAFQRGTTIANTRQVSLVSIEELAVIAAKLKVRRIDPAWLAANIATEGLGPITQLPPGSIVRSSSGASIFIAELNTPCRAAAALLAHHGGYTGGISAFMQHAAGRRGVVGFVYARGKLAVGDELEVLIAHRGTRVTGGR